MVEKLRDLDDVIDGYAGLSRKVLDYSQLMKRMVGEAKQPGFNSDGWAPLLELIEAEKFVRIGNFKEVMNWEEYINFLTDWASSFEWDCSFRRVHENGNTVYLELEERSELGDFKSVVNSMSVYEFNDDGKIEYIDVYLQMELPSGDMLKSYENVDMS